MVFVSEVISGSCADIGMKGIVISDIVVRPECHAVAERVSGSKSIAASKRVSHGGKGRGCREDCQKKEHENLSRKDRMDDFFRTGRKIFEVFFQMYSF